MKISFSQKLSVSFGTALIGIVFVALTGHSSYGQTKTPARENAESPVTLKLTDTQTNAVAKPISASTIAPYLVKDTESDSPGTNIVTRIVTFTAQIGGTPPVAFQWKVNKGGGFVEIAGATNATLRIGNAQVVDSGLYALFATNSGGEIHTSPLRLIVTEGED